MKYLDLRHIFSAARTNRYLFASKNDKRKAVLLYKANLQLCQRFYGILNIFEVLLRNVINDHYTKQFGADWIVNLAVKDKLLENNIDEITDAEQTYRKAGNYSPDRMASSFTFGFWTYMFTKNKYRLGGKTLLQIFPKKATGTTQKIVYQDLTRIREFRNRIAHHEPIVFDTVHRINLTYVTEIYSTIQRYVSFMGFDPDYVFKIAERPDEILKEIGKMKF